MNTPDIGTTYMGLELSSPLIVSSCPPTGNVGQARALEEAGASAIILPSLFQEQVEHEESELGRLRDLGSGSFSEASDYFPDLEFYNAGPDGYLRLVERARAALGIPVIASLNGVSAAGWARYAKLVEDAGASAIELNVLHVPTDPRKTAKDVESLYVDQVAAVANAVEIPIALKIGAHLSAPANFAVQLRDAGAAGLVLFNRFLEPDLDLDTMEVVPRLELSRPTEMRMALRWIAILSSHGHLSLATTGGAHSTPDVIKLLMAGADAVMVASAILIHGPEFISETLKELRAWLVENEYKSVRQMRGSMNQANCPDPAGYERLNYMKALTSFTTPLR
jgi:dihydroorotate dehydrogenase (fumarate)